MFWMWLLPTSAVCQPATRISSTNVLALSESARPLCRNPCSDGSRPVIKVARFG